MLQVSGLTKHFQTKGRPQVVGVDHVSFEARPGEVLGLLGPNGAGKTTTLRMLATLLQPSEGSATVNGFDLVRQPEQVRRQIGFLSGEMGLYHRLTPREILTFFGRVYGLRSAALDGRISQLFDDFGVTEYQHARVDTLSTGMKQKVAICRTVVHDPPLLIMDEPTNGLDVPAAAMVEQFLLAAKRSGKCVVFSTHIMEEAEYLCDRIAVVHQGKIQALGTIEELRVLSGKQRLREIFLTLLGMGEGARTVGV